MSEFPTFLEHLVEYPDQAHYIYGLFDPETGELRYIGKSDRPRGRLADQLNDRSNTHRCHWIQSLKGRGLTPVQRIIDSVPIGDDWQTVERAYIRGALAAGYPLTNATDGGDGVVGLSPESRARITAAWVGRKHRPESLVKIGNASRGRRHVLTPFAGIGSELYVAVKLGRRAIGCELKPSYWRTAVSNLTELEESMLVPSLFDDDVS